MPVDWRPIEKVNAARPNEASFECLKQFSTHYQSNTVDLQHELHSIRRLVENKSENLKTVISLHLG
jgi:hypothetical protein